MIYLYAYFAVSALCLAFNHAASVNNAELYGAEHD